MAANFVLNVRHNLDAMIARIDDIQNKQIPFVTAVALTNTGKDVKQAEEETIARVFDRPTRFTLNSLKLKPATKSDLNAIVDFKEGHGSVPAWRYLGPQVEGGGRAHKSFEKRLIQVGLMLTTEFAVPGLGATLDASGNISGSTITRILSDLGAQADKHQNATERSRKRAKRRGRGQYLVLRGEGGAKPGIYFRKGAKEIVPVMLFVRAAKYEQRYPFHDVARQTAQRNFARHFRAAWDRYVVQVGVIAPVRKVA